MTVTNQLAKNCRSNQSFINRVSNRVIQLNPVRLSGLSIWTQPKSAQPFDTHCCHVGAENSVPGQVKPSLIFWHLGTLTLSCEHQSARMSKITSDGLTWPGTGCLIFISIWQKWASKGEFIYCYIYRQNMFRYATAIDWWLEKIYVDRNKGPYCW